MTDLIFWLLGLGKKNSYSQPKYVQHLLEKGPIDSTSEVFAAATAAIMFTAEYLYREHGSTVQWTVAREKDNVTFTSEMCSFSCVEFSTQLSRKARVHYII